MGLKATYVGTKDGLRLGALEGDAVGAGVDFPER